MAYINGEYEHEDYEIVISVLEPNKHERDYKGGMKITVDWDSFANLPLSEFKNVLKWMQEKADYIENNFDKSGKNKNNINA